MATLLKSDLQTLDYHDGLPLIGTVAYSHDANEELIWWGLPYGYAPTGTSTPEPPTYNTAQFMIMF